MPPQQGDTQASSSATAAKAIADLSVNNPSTGTIAASIDPNPWQTSCSGLTARLGTLRKLGLWTDCEFAVGTSQERVRAHRVLLSSASPVLAAMLFRPLARMTHSLALPNIEPDIFDRVLEFIYTDNITVDSCDVACGLYQAANYLNLPHVKTVCKTYLIANVSAESALHVYEFAEMFGEEEIMQKCLKVMDEMTQEVLRSARLCEARAGTLARLFARADLCIQSELELLSAAERWSLAHPAEQESKDENKTLGGAGDNKPIKNESEDCSQDAKTLIRSAVKHIRFLTIARDELAQRDMSMLLTESEILAIVFNRLSTQSKMPMPEGFSTSRKTRCNKERFILTTSHRRAHQLCNKRKRGFLKL